MEPLPGWSHAKENGRPFECSRPDSPGWSEDEKQQVDALRARQMEPVITVFVHPCWATCDAPVTARSTLKHAHEHSPAEERDDIPCS